MPVSAPRVVALACSSLLAAITACRCGARSWRSGVNATAADSSAAARQSAVVAAAHPGLITDFDNSDYFVPPEAAP